MWLSVGIDLCGILDEVVTCQKIWWPRAMNAATFMEPAMYDMYMYIFNHVKQSSVVITIFHVCNI